MPLKEIHFSIDGDVQYSRAFEVMAHEAGDLTEPLTEIGDQVRHAVGLQFGSEGAHSGDPWARLTSDYQKWKDQEYGPGLPVLVRTGAMRYAALAPDAVQVTPDRLVYEVDGVDQDGQDIGERAYFHQKGKGHLPARELLNLNADDRRQWDRVFASWLNDLRRGVLGRTR